MNTLWEHAPDQVSIYEVGPRDGLQNERVTVPLADKLRLIEGLVWAGLTRIEITSFVSPKWIPQLADADDLVKHMPKTEGVQTSALCPNLKGLERAHAAGLREVAVFLSASETHNRKNINKDVASTLSLYAELASEAKKLGIRVRGYVSTVWGCPYEGEVGVAASVAIAERLTAMGCYEISLGDTIGSGTPKQTTKILSAMAGSVGLACVAMHMHDTRGTALANIVAGLAMGVRVLDASIGGMGGCPYAPGAAGNVATEDLVYMLSGMGIETGIDLERLVECSRAAGSIVGRQLPGKVQQAGTRSLRA
jgi:hydroxymethylglutaryl-CoA lyase